MSKGRAEKSGASAVGEENEGLELNLERRDDLIFPSLSLDLVENGKAVKGEPSDRSGHVFCFILFAGLLTFQISSHHSEKALFTIAKGQHLFCFMHLFCFVQSEKHLAWAPPSIYFASYGFLQDVNGDPL